MTETPHLVDADTCAGDGICAEVCPEDILEMRDGKVLAAYLDQQLGVELGIRQCQRLFLTLGFRLRKPRPEIAHADPERQRVHRKQLKR